REARRLLKERIRNDWDYPPLPAYRVPSGRSQEEKAIQAEDEATVADDLQSPTSNGSAKSTYKFEGPDSVGVEVSDRRIARRRKRQKVLEEEMIWNDGLAHWVRRRDAWCGARTTTQVKDLEHQDHLPPDVGAEPVASDSSTSSPLMAPILPEHPIRRRISPMMYNEIYSKIIIQSRTPSIPINLLTLVSALVQGWKDDGEWPPKATPLEPSVGKRRQARG
ncbi:hypothetical protein M433DRAFT_35977, partial [Acidomyces richmondensis BFW]